MSKVTEQALPADHRFLLPPKRPALIDKSTKKDAHTVGLNNVSESNNSINPPIPKGCRPLTHQVAGHRYGKGKLGIGMLQHIDGSILKPVQPPPRGEREVNFYTRVFDESCDDPVMLTLRPFLPKLLGIWTPPLPPTDDRVHYSYLKLEDACRRFRNPSILDIKLGRVSHDPDADEQKRTIESAKYPPLRELGFQLLGMRVSGPSPNEAVFYDKHYGRSLTKDKVTEGLELFLGGNRAWKKNIIKAFIQRLEMILSWFESQQKFQFYASSLLLIYEGEFLDGSSDSDEEFMHKYRCRQLPGLPTENYLATIRKVMRDTDEKFPVTDGSDGANEANDIPAVTREICDLGNKTHTAEDQSKSPQVNATNEAPPTPTGPVSATPETAPLSTGHESGYSSEVDAKKSKTETSRREFVKLLSRRVQESARNYVKYQFPPEIVDVRMIDFAHVFEEPHVDENYVYGLRNLIATFRKILKKL